MFERLMIAAVNNVPTMRKKREKKKRHLREIKALINMDTMQQESVKAR